MAATAAAGHGIVLAAADDCGLVDFDEAGGRGSARGHHAAPQLCAE